jgi:uncharacterized membrane protein SirB2
MSVGRPADRVATCRDKEWANNAVLAVSHLPSERREETDSVDLVRHLLLFLHLLGMALLIGTFMLQFKAGKDAPLNKGWLHGSALQLVTGIALMLLAPLTHQDYNHIKLGVKLLVLIVIGVLAVFHVSKERVPKWLGPTLGGLVVLNVGLAVFWS